jgi:GTP-binding protein Era
MAKGEKKGGGGPRRGGDARGRGGRSGGRGAKARGRGPRSGGGRGRSGPRGRGGPRSGGPRGSRPSGERRRRDERPSTGHVTEVLADIQAALGGEGMEGIELPPKPEHKTGRPVVPRPVEPEIPSEDGSFRAGYVALVGRPNVGKSTILNAVLGQKIAATSHKPQTTRKNLLGVLHPKNAQILFLDTPGHHKAEGPLNRFMVGQVQNALRDADVIAFVVEGRDVPKITPGNQRILEEILRANRPVVLLINKIDRVPDKTVLLPLMQRYQEAIGERLQTIVPISAMRRSGLERAVIAIGQALPIGPALFDESTMTDASERSITAELIREKLILETREELPYSAAVTIDAFEDDRPRLVHIMATVHVERPSQKAIVIGKGGERMKAIGQRARIEIESFLGAKVFLELNARVTTRWTERPRVLAELGYVEGFEEGS